jgi:hypothetical protein
LSRLKVSGDSCAFAFQLLIELGSFVLRPLALPGFRRASSLLWPLLTSYRLSAMGSLRVSAQPVASRRLALPSPSMTLGLRLCSPARPRLSASLPVRVPTVEGSLPPFRSSLTGRLLASASVVVISPSGTFHPERLGTCRTHECARPRAQQAASAPARLISLELRHFPTLLRPSTSCDVASAVTDSLPRMSVFCSSVASPVIDC